MVVLAAPTLYALGRDLWSIEAGTHGPIVLATGIWLLLRERDRIRALARPGSPALAFGLFLPSLLVVVFGRITSMLGIECLGVYGAFLAIFYFHVGATAVRAMWFPLAYLLFLFPQPETIVLPLSHLLKLAISTSAVDMLSALGYRIGQGGVVIYVDRYELLIATACSGLQSLIGLGAVGVFFCYVRYQGDWRASVPLLLLIPPIALFANFVRVVTLVLATHYLGQRSVQMFVHDSAAFIFFAFALGLILGVGMLIDRMREARLRRG